MIYEEVQDLMTEAGVDVKDGMGRFVGKLDLFVKIFRKYDDDNNMDLLRDAMEAGNVDAAFSAAHTLKGVCGNLSMKRMFDIASEMTEFLREKDMDSARQMMPKLEEEHQKIKTLLRYTKPWISLESRGLFHLMCLDIREAGAIQSLLIF